MSFFNIVAATNEDTVVATYEPSKVRSDSYQSEAELEKEFIRLLCEQGYTYLPLHTEDELIANLRSQLEELNHYHFSDTEWRQFFSDVIANPNEHIPEKTRKIQEDNVQVLHRDDGSSKNITLIDKKNIHNNRLQVINQYEVKQADGARHDNRYDVTILVNGFPLVHVELKRRGVAIREAFNQINRYQRDSFWAGCGLYEYVQIFVISNGTNTKLRKYADYYHGYTDEQGKYHQGYTDMIDDLTQKFPLTEPQIIGEQNQKDFIVLFGALLRMRNLLSSFDDFKGNEMISERDLQDYLGRYQDLRDEWRNKKHDETKEDITDDVVFEVELIRQVEINIDYILMLVKKYHDTHCDDKEVLITIRKAIDASPELRSKKQLIETFIAGVNDVDDVMAEWNTYVSEQREKELAKIIQEEKLKEPETRKYLANAFRDGEIKTVGTDIDKLMPPVSRFGGGGRAQKKQGVIDKLKSFFDKFFGIGGGYDT